MEKNNNSNAQPKDVTAQAPVEPEKADPKPQEAEPAATPDVAAIAREAAVTAVSAERDRVTAIQEICGGDYPEIEKEAIKADWTPDVVSQKVLATIRAERPTSSVNIVVKSKPEGDEMRKTLEAAMCLRVGVPAEDVEKSHGAKALEAGMAEMDMPVKQLLIECMRLEGVPVSRSFDNAAIQAAFSTEGWRATVAALKEASLEFGILYDTEDEDFQAFSDAYFNNTPLSLFITDGNGNGLDADFSITGFSIEQPLEEAVSVSITAKPTASERPPQ